MNLETIYEQCADAGHDALLEATTLDITLTSSERIAFARAAIETYLKLNPVWVKASDRMPNEEDADKTKNVAVLLDGEEFYYADFRKIHPDHYWSSIKHLPPLPPPPDPFTEWYAKQPNHITSLPKETVKDIYQSLTTTKP